MRSKYMRSKYLYPSLSSNINENMFQGLSLSLSLSISDNAYVSLQYIIMKCHILTWLLGMFSHCFTVLHCFPF